MSTLIRVFGLSAAIGLMAGPIGTAQANPFWSYWSDGRAELNGYDLIQPRYGEKRHGRAVLVYVTEPYSLSRQVKVDRYDRDNPDHRTVLKLNHVRKFQTGIYDYSVMTSVFADPVRGFAPTKITFSSQEWCGHVFERAVFDGDGGALTLDSYFEGESGQTAVPGPLWTEDGLFIAVRSLDAETLRRETPSGGLLPSALWRRLAHRPATLHPTSLKWRPGTTRRTTPAGTFEVASVDYQRAPGLGCTLHVAVPYPHHIVAWECTNGETAQLTGSTRAPYWRQHREGDERILKALGLSAPSHAP